MIIDAPADICSAAGCRATAAHRVLWRNPRIHTEDRVKTWLACDAHVEHLRDFLAARDFPVRVIAHAPASDSPETP